MLEDRKYKRFWDGDQLLKEKFPRLYSISLSKNSVVSDIREWVTSDNKESQRWNLSWRKETFVQKKKQEQQLISILTTIQWKRSISNVWLWYEDDKKVYTVRSSYRVLNDEGNFMGINIFKQLWTLKVAPLAQVCVWRILLDRLQIRKNLVRRGVALISTLCSFCNKVEETIQYLFINCEVVQKVWDSCDIWIGNAFVRHHSVYNHLHNFYMMSFSNKEKTVWKGKWVAIVLEI